MSRIHEVRSQKEQKGKGEAILPSIHLFYKAYMFDVVSLLYWHLLWNIWNITSLVMRLILWRRLQNIEQVIRLTGTVQRLLGFMHCHDDGQREEGLKLEREQAIDTLGCSTGSKLSVAGRTSVNRTSRVLFFHSSCCLFVPLMKTIKCLSRCTAISACKSAVCPSILINK